MSARATPASRQERSTSVSSCNAICGASLASRICACPAGRPSSQARVRTRRSPLDVALVLAAAGVAVTLAGAGEAAERFVVGHLSGEGVPVRREVGGGGADERGERQAFADGAFDAQRGRVDRRRARSAWPAVSTRPPP
ncbi:hypothetical protein [Dermacoccus sp. GAS27A]|uniref:hypothetical protein n=1 Tax=Dermacoccus sp. GAS27A TaxID=3156270 RepID=UPI003839CCA5